MLYSIPDFGCATPSFICPKIFSISLSETGTGMPLDPRKPLTLFKFFQEVKQEAFKVSWPTGKETLQGALMVFAMAVVMSLFFLLLDQVLKFFLELLLKVSI